MPTPARAQSGSTSQEREASRSARSQGRPALPRQRLLDAVAQPLQEQAHALLLLALGAVVRRPVLAVGLADGALGHDDVVLGKREFLAVVAERPLVLAGAAHRLEVGTGTS